MTPKKEQMKKAQSAAPTNLLDYKIKKTTPFGPLARGVVTHKDVIAQEKK